MLPTEGDTKEHQTLRHLLGKLEERQNHLKYLDAYFDGEQPLAFLTPKDAERLKNRVTKLTVNIPRLVVNSLAERLRIIALVRGGQIDPWLWSVWQQNDCDEQSAALHREVLALGKAFVLVWADDKGNPTLSVETARQFYAIEDPGTGEIRAAVKRWTRPDVERPELSVDVAVLYLPNEIIRFESNPSTAPEAGAWNRVNTIPNPLGFVPVVQFKNSERLSDEHGISEMRDVIPMTDGLTKIMSDVMVTSEYYARPRRWATGIELEDNEDFDNDKPESAENPSVKSPFPENSEAPWTSESELTKFGNFETANMNGYEVPVRILLGQIMAVSTLPAHYVGILSNSPVSADSIRASEASLTARAHARMRSFGRSWERVLRMVYEVGERTLMPSEHVSAVWADPSTRTIAQEADAASKISDSLGSVPPALLERLGFDPNMLPVLNPKNENGDEEA
ncbi:phage portal protein [uncultured Nocardioides sp.]|uniref:phage portal protein n=1 Tax=uncultured Nocardioides sp. TaxID=198441 RepID=UPI002625C515|nr:phage portal protein [uncultured Nocardioides sp.]